MVHNHQLKINYGVYQDYKRGRFCIYKDYENLKSKKRLHYILPNQNYIITEKCLN